MIKYLIGAAAGIALVVGGYAAAATQTQGVSGLHRVDYNEYITKIYDSDANVICYTTGPSGISCLKNI